jgi:Ca2+-binding RTX toxin-like protein
MVGAAGRPANPFAGIDGDSDSSVVFTDLDSDGDLDLVVVGGIGRLFAFQRSSDGSFVATDGAAGRPADPFAEVNFYLFGEVVARSIMPAFTDLDGDGDLDLVIGERNGRLFAFQRNGHGSFTAMDGTAGRPANPFASIDVGFYSNPDFTDLDGDGDLDLVVGADGTLHSFRRDGTNFTELTGSTNPFNDIDWRRYTAPSFTDLDGDGILDLVAGSWDRTRRVFSLPRGQDSLAGGAGNDTLDGGMGADTMAGGIGNDAFYVDDAGDLVQESSGQGTDTILLRLASYSLAGLQVENITGAADRAFTMRGNGLANVLTGAAQADTLNGDAGSDTLVGGAGSDVLTGGRGNDSMVGGSGFDWISFAELLSGQAVTVDFTAGRVTGAAGNDSFAGIEAVTAGTGNDSILAGSASGQTLAGEAGADTLIAGGAGTQALFGGADADNLQGGSGDGQTLAGDAGADTLVAGQGRFQALYGGNDADNLRGGAGFVQELHGGSGNDTLIAGDGSLQSLLGGNDADSLLGGAGIGQGLYGDAGNDTLVAGLGDNQYLSGGIGADSLRGGAANDVLLGGRDDDIIIGGASRDRVSYTDIEEAVTVDLFAMRSVGAGGNDTLAEIENVTGGSGHDSLLGDSAANVLGGYFGHDTLAGDAGDDTLNGADGNDRLVGGSGADWVSYVASVTVDLTAQRAISTAEGNDTFDGIENILASDAHDSLLGDGLANNLVGSGGNDTIDGGADNDVLTGGLGDDSLVGGSSSDWISFADLPSGQAITVNFTTGRVTGAAGNDSFAGIEAVAAGTGNDSILAGLGAGQTLSGEAGADTLVAGGAALSACLAGMMPIACRAARAPFRNSSGKQAMTR